MEELKLIAFALLGFCIGYLSVHLGYISNKKK